MAHPRYLRPGRPFGILVGSGVVMGSLLVLGSASEPFLNELAEIGFWWDPDSLAWSRPGLPLLSNLAGPFQHFKAAILDA